MVDMASTMLPLSPDDLLSTTRAVRKRLDLSRPVERETISECLAVAQQAPSGSNAQRWHFVVVLDSSRKAAIAELYRRSWAAYVNEPVGAGNLRFGDQERQSTQERVVASASYLAEHFHEVPAQVIPCISGRLEGAPAHRVSSAYASIVPAAWSFQLAARARGLGTCFTTLHLRYEEEAAAVLGIPHAEVTQAGLIVVAHSKGTDFRPAQRDPLERMVHWDRW